MTAKEWLKKMDKRGYDCAKTRIVKALACTPGEWHETGRLNGLFCGSKCGSWFIGVSWSRRIRELAEEGIVQRRIIKEGPHKGQAEWRVGK